MSTHVIILDEAQDWDGERTELDGVWLSRRHAEYLAQFIEGIVGATAHKGADADPTYPGSWRGIRFDTWLAMLRPTVLEEEAR